MKRIGISLFCFAVILAFATGVRAQSPKTTDLAVKDTAANQTLVDTAKSEVADKAAMNTKFQQARASLDQNLKALQDELQKTQKDLQEKLKADKKYGPVFAHIDDLQKQIGTANQTANANFQKDAGVLSQKLQSELSQIDILVKTVKKEQNLPDNATFSDETQKWSVPADKK